MSCVDYCLRFTSSHFIVTTDLRVYGSELQSLTVLGKIEGLDVINCLQFLRGGGGGGGGGGGTPAQVWLRVELHNPLLVCQSSH